MDYLNYGKKVQQQTQPQKPQPQVFGNQVQLTKNDFSFGDLNQQTIQQQAEFPIESDELMQLFPVPLLICPYPFDYSKELEWIKKQECRNEKKTEENVKRGSKYPLQNLNRQSKDTFILDKPEMSRIRKFIEVKLKEFVSNVMGSDSEMVITQSWFNKNGKGESHHAHKHPNSMVSGVWYPLIHEKLPPIQFRIGQQRDVSFSIKRWNHFNNSSFMLPMKAGELIIFPSNLMHGVPANLCDEERISLSFNTWAKGNLGNEKDLTYLPLDRCV